MQKVNRDDRISSLPDDILLNILDQLNVRDAATTCHLRWRQLPAMLSRLTISAQDFLPSIAKTSLSKHELVRRTDEAVVEATRSILARRDPGGCIISLLRMTFYLRDDAPISIGHAVSNTMATHKIEQAEFTVLADKKCVDYTTDDLENNGARFVSFFNECPNAFAGLTCLYLEKLIFATSDFVSNITVTCKQLKYLGFFHCYTYTEGLIMLEVEHTQLSELCIINCRFGMVKLTRLPKLTRLAFEHWLSYEEPPLSIGYVPLLKALSLSNVASSSHKMVELSKFLYETSVQDLRLGFKFEKIWVQPECLNKRLAFGFCQLKIVNLVNIPEGYDLTWTMFVLEAAPTLEELYMMVMDHPCEMQTSQEISENKGVEWESPTSNSKHHCLTKFIMFGFQVNDYMVDHVKRVMKAAVNLQDVYLHDRLICDNLVRDMCPGPHLPINFPLTSEERRSVQKRMPRGIGSLVIIHFLTNLYNPAAYSL
ncbi:hypothetical protein VPH35_119463 [Triticum aestivum]